METITLRELREAVHGELLGDFRREDTPITGAESDNRRIKPGNVFFAFRGEKADGHRFVKAALAAGASGAVVSEDPDEYLPGKFYVKVQDTLLAAGDLARAYRRRFAIPVVAVTGSVGKTTMKDMIYAVLSERFCTLRTEANFNNNIGVPRTILRLDRGTQMAVVEMGMNHFGEIDYLVHIAQPTCAVITNIGEAHIGNLGGKKENIFKAKCEIFGGLAEGGLAVMNGDDAYLRTLREDREKQEKFHFAWVGESRDCTFRAVHIEDTLQDAVQFTMETPDGSFPVKVPALGRHMIYPALTAAAIGMHYGMTAKEIAAGIAHYVPTAMRMETVRLPEGIIVYNDTYNANPQSMKAGLLTLSHTKGQRHVAVLGDMLELGDAEERLHREVGRAAAEGNIDTLITVGRAAGWIADEAERRGLADVRICHSREEAEPVLRALLGPETVFYFKASHAMALEKLAAYTADMAKSVYGDL